MLFAGVESGIAFFVSEQFSSPFIGDFFRDGYADKTHRNSCLFAEVDLPVEPRAFFEDSEQVDLVAVGIEEICFMMVSTEKICQLVHDSPKDLRYEIAKVTNTEVAG